MKPWSNLHVAAGLRRLPHRAARRPGVVAAIVVSTATLACAHERSHCSAQQRTLFSCSTGSKTVSVCASTDLTAGAGSLQYRFGPPGRPEWAYPPEGADWRAVTSGGQLMFSGGGGSYLAFTNGEHRYVVYTAIGKGWGSKAGVAVERRGQRLANLGCVDAPVSELGPDLSQAAGIMPDSVGFDLP